MADVIIRDMKMPKNCFLCKLAQHRMFTGCVMCPITEQIVGHYHEGFHQEAHTYPLVPLPEKHGRIVDAAEVIEKANNSAWFDGDVSELGLLLGSEVTTIVPAEGGEEDGE